MIKWLSLPESTKRNAFIQIAEETGMSAFAVEKDWWVSRTLEIIFQMDIAKHLVFKGGTSLSKAWNLINRFSEDIDLAIDMDFFMTPTKNWSKGERTKLRKTAGEYSTSIFFVELEAEFLKRGFENLHFTIVETSESDRDPRVLEIQYPNLIEQQTDYMLPRIQIEVSCRSLREPFSIQKFGSLVDEVYFEREFAQSFFQVPTVNPERTFLEKIFLLHEEFKRPEEKMRVDRLSRHLYDVYHLIKAGIADRAINDKELYETIVSHRYLFSKIGGVDYNSHNPATLNPIPPNKVQKDWESDYAKMKEEMIYEKNPPSFEDLISNLSNLKDQLLNVGWKFELTFKP
jgi:predicted nucleotidyltransferase component of viral defense system